MFKKKPNIKPLAPIRSSDRRKIADQIISEFQIELPKPQDGDSKEDEEAINSLTIGALRNSLLPENSLSARFTTTAGADLKQISGAVYIGAYPEEDQRILWFKIEERILPTVYTLWKHPGLVPLLHTVDFVVDKLCTGSPLMTPGLAAGPPFPKQATKNAIVAIASVENPSVPKVLGVCEIDVSSLTQVQGVKGRAVRAEHWEGDEAWAWSSSGRPGAPSPERIDQWILGGGGKDMTQEVGNLSLEDDDEEDDQGGVSLESRSNVQSGIRHTDEEVDGEDAEKSEEQDLSTKDIDNAFWRAFLYAVHQSRETHKNEKNHGLSFPIPQSLIISNMVLPYLPIFTAKQAAALQIKKTSWKTPKKLIKALEKAKILKSKDRDGGECVVVDIDFEDPAVQEFVPYLLPKKEAAGAESGRGAGGRAIATSNPHSDPSIGQRLHKIDLFRPEKALSPIFSLSKASTGMLYLPSELRLITTTYIESEQLVFENNKRLININPVLADAVFNGKSKYDHEIITKRSVPRDELVQRIQQSCAPHYMILRNDETRENGKAMSGTGPVIHIVLETRSGSKTVTKVSGVEVFHISPALLADELQKSCASSTSVGQLIGSSPKHPVMEILVQGPQKEAVTKALEKRGVHRSWIEVKDKTKGKKKS